MTMVNKCSHSGYRYIGPKKSRNRNAKEVVNKFVEIFCVTPMVVLRRLCFRRGLRFRLFPLDGGHDLPDVGKAFHPPQLLLTV